MLMVNAMKQLIIKVGELKKDLKMAFENPSKAKPNSHTLYLKNSNELSEILSPKRLELLIYLIENQRKKKTIGEAALELKRKQEAISRDAIVLEKFCLIQKTKEKQRVFLKPLYKSLNIQLSGN